jgi:hypothetical protein
MDASSDSAYRALAAKIDSLGQLCARLARENAALHDQVSRLGAVASAASAATTASAVERQPAPAALQPGPAAGPAQPAGGQANVLEGRVTRRLAGRTLGVAAAGLMGAVALTELGARPAAASDGQPLTLGEGNPIESPTTIGWDGRTKITTMFLVNDTDLGPSDSLFRCALAGWGGPGNAVNGPGSTDTGVFGFTASGNGRGVVGVNGANTPRQLAGAGVLGKGEHGVVGVRGMSDTGRGGVFSGGAAQVRLMPGSKSTHPASGNRGDLYADSLGRLWFCKVPGARAHWHQIA